MLMLNIYNAETIQQQTSYRMTVDIMAATLKPVIRGEGTVRDIETFVLLTNTTILLLLLYTDLITREQQVEAIYKITHKDMHFYIYTSS